MDKIATVLVCLIVIAVIAKRPSVTATINEVPVEININNRSDIEIGSTYWFCRPNTRYGDWELAENLALSNKQNLADGSWYPENRYGLTVQVQYRKGTIIRINPGWLFGLL